MTSRRAATFLLIGSLSGSPLLVGCESLPGEPETQGAVIGGVGGALAGAALGGEENRLLGALLGGALGAGGGYLIGANWDKITGDERDEARYAVERAERNPATVEDVRRSYTADLNDDGFVTMDEIVAMERAELTDGEIIDRIERTNQYFELNSQQVEYLRDRGVSADVVYAIQRMNRGRDFDRSLDEPEQRIGRER